MPATCVQDDDDAANVGAIVVQTFPEGPKVGNKSVMQMARGASVHYPLTKALEYERMNDFIMEALPQYIVVCAAETTCFGDRVCTKCTE